MQFVALDVETANRRRGSICQIGIVLFDASGIVDEYETLINPRDIFSPGNTRIHGIRAGDVTHAPTFAQAAPEILARIDRQIVVAHNAAFDRSCLREACEYSGLRAPWCRWLCSVQVARRIFRGHLERFRLNDVANHLGISFQHHDALDDARTCGEIVRRACRQSGLDVEDWLSQVRGPVGGQIGQRAPQAAAGSISARAMGCRRARA